LGAMSNDHPQIMMGDVIEHLVPGHRPPRLSCQLHI
jgi:hypothetical protein